MTGFIQETIHETTPIVPNDFRHALCIGETGCGKTTSFMLPNISDRIEKNYGMLIIDIKGNLHSDVKVVASNNDRLNDVIEIGVPWGHKINIFENISRSLFLNTLSDVYGSSDDKFWSNAALSIAGLIYDIIDIAENLSYISKDFNYRSFNYCINSETMNNIVSSIHSLDIFIIDCKFYATALLEDILPKQKDKISDDDIYLINQFGQEFNELVNKLKNFYNDIDVDSPAAGSGGVFFSLRNIISAFSQDGFDGKDELKELLEDGKIVIIHANNYDETVSLALMNILYKRLLIRDNERPITLFIDEFQRSVSKDNIPYIDLFREMNVELIAAMQNLQQLENKLEDTKSDELLGNILHNYEYANHRENSLDTFEFIYKSKKAKAKAMFLKEEEKVLAQVKWQSQSSNPPPQGWIYVRPDGYKRSIIINIKTKERKHHYILDKKRRRLKITPLRKPFYKE